MTTLSTGELERQNKILKILLQYCLFERKQETQLAMAFSILVQERHNQFHTVGNRKDGDGTEFIDCPNELCAAARAVLNEGRAMAVEINDLSIQMIADFNLTIQKQGNTCRAYLTPKQQVQTPPLVAPVPSQDITLEGE